MGLIRSNVFEVDKDLSGNLADIQRKLMKNGELLSDGVVHTDSELKFGRYFIENGLRVHHGWRLGKFEFDFKIKDYPVLVEIDGSIHRTPSKHSRDCYKDRLALIKGFVVLRFMNSEDPEFALSTIRKVVARQSKSPREVIAVHAGFFRSVKRWLGLL